MLEKSVIFNGPFNLVLLSYKLDDQGIPTSELELIYSLAGLINDSVTIAVKPQSENLEDFSKDIYANLVSAEVVFSELAPSDIENIRTAIIDVIEIQFLDKNKKFVITNPTNIIFSVEGLKTKIKIEKISIGANITVGTDITDAFNIEDINGGGGGGSSHEHPNKEILDLITAAFTTELQETYDGAVELAHDHSNKETLDIISAEFIEEIIEFMESGGGGSSHEHSNLETLEGITEPFTTELKTDYDGAVELAHEHSNKEILDEIEVAFTEALQEAYDEAVELKHSHSNKAILDAITVAFTTAMNNYLNQLKSLILNGASYGKLLVGWGEGQVPKWINIWEEPLNIWTEQRYHFNEVKMEGISLTNFDIENIKNIIADKIGDSWDIADDVEMHNAIGGDCELSLNEIEVENSISLTADKLSNAWSYNLPT